MKHFGDITALHGGELPPVDIITFGSPCQGLSIAGQRLGLADDRSGLFLHATRIIQEMREATNGRYPTFAVWENVPGAFSSAKGEDFRHVLEELARIAEQDAAIPRPPKGWTNAGVILTDGWSIAWRVCDAQFWGVPQRRRRIALVMDFGGDRAPEILFEREGVSRDSAPCRWTWERTAGRFVPCTDLAVGALPADDCNGEETVCPEVARCLKAKGNVSFREDCEAIIAKPVVYENHSQDSRIKELGEVAPSVAAKYGTGGNNMPIVCSAFCAGDEKNAFSIHQNQFGELRINEIANTLSTNGNASGRNAPLIMATGQANAEITRDLCPSLNCDHEAPIAAKAIDCRNFNVTAESGPLQAKENGGQSLNFINPVIQAVQTLFWIVRRLTPTECARLQGYPDDWCKIPPTTVNGKLVKHSDSAEYKAYGNSIALPQWHWLMLRIAGYLPTGATLGSLFDGIGGFPLIHERIHGKGTALWASEIEPFCVAVTQYHFGEE